MRRISAPAGMVDDADFVIFVSRYNALVRSESVLVNG